MAPRKTPGGGPKPDKLMRDALALELHQEVKLTTGEKVKKLRLVARTLVDNAIDGDTTAARECFDRMDGKVTQGVDASAWRHHGHLGAASVLIEALFSPQLLASAGRHSPRHSSLVGSPLAAVHSLFSPQRAAPAAWRRSPRSTLPRRSPSGATRRLCRESGGVRKCATCA